MVTVSLAERALLGKLFYENKGNDFGAVLGLRRIKIQRCGLTSTKGISATFKRFEETRRGNYELHPEEGVNMSRLCLLML